MAVTRRTRAFFLLLASRCARTRRMKKISRAATILIFAMCLLASCAKKKEAAVPEDKLKEVLGFVSRAPADSEGFAGFYRLGKKWDELKQSRFVAALRANRFVQSFGIDLNKVPQPAGG